MERVVSELSGPSGLSEASVLLYRHAVTEGGFDPTSAGRALAMSAEQLAEARATLLRLRLLADGDPPGVLLPVHPDVARVRVNEPLVGEIEAREQAIDANDRQLRRFNEVLAQATPNLTGSEDVRVLASPAEVQRELDSWTLRCSRELVTMHPGGPRWDDHLMDLAPTDLAMLKRGVARRMLYQHTARANLGMRSFVSQLADAGGLVRTTSEGHERLAIFDRRIAFLPSGPPGRQPSGAAVVTHPAVVDFLHRGFERAWSGATPFDGKDAQYDEVSDDIKLSLLRLMASGLKDEAIANRLGMATRTCRRYMAAIMDELNASSRFQAGVKIARLGMLSPEQAAGVRADAHPWW